MRVAVLGILRSDDRPVPLTITFSEHPEVVAVKMHGVVEGGDAREDDSDGDGVAVVVDVPFWLIWIRGVAGIGESEDWLAVEQGQQDADVVKLRRKLTCSPP